MVDLSSWYRELVQMEGPRFLADSLYTNISLPSPANMSDITVLSLHLLLGCLPFHKHSSSRPLFVSPSHRSSDSSFHSPWRFVLTPLQPLLISVSFICLLFSHVYCLVPSLCVIFVCVSSFISLSSQIPPPLFLFIFLTYLIFVFFV